MTKIISKRPRTKKPAKLPSVILSQKYCIQIPDKRLNPGFWRDEKVRNLDCGQRRLLVYLLNRTSFLKNSAQQAWIDACGRERAVPYGRHGLRPSAQRGHAELWQFVLWRAHGKCEACGGEAAVVDHVIARVRGGSSHPDNLGALCRQCNSRKVALFDASTAKLGYLTEGAHGVAP